MKILHILDHSAPVADGYSIRSQNILRSQAEHGLEPVAVTSARQADKYNAAYPGPVEDVDGIRFHRTATMPESRWPLVPEYQRLRRMTRRIDEVVKIERPDILHAHSPSLWGLAASRVASRLRIPLVYEVRGFWEDALVDSGRASPRSLRYRLMRSLESRVCQSADIVTTIAEGLRNDLVSRGVERGKIVLAPNCVEAERFERLQPDQALLQKLGFQNKTLIGYIGSLFAWEGVDDLIRAVPELIRKAPETRVLIVGGGELEPLLHELVQQLGVAEYVTLVGRVPHGDVTRYYSILDVLVYPRRPTRNTELCTPLKPLEAMAMEKAVVGSNVGGIRELLAEGTGLQFRAGDPADLADKCLQLVHSAELRTQMGARARVHVAEERNWKKLAATYADIYASLAPALSAADEQLAGIGAVAETVSAHEASH
jgi:PEP-CTERM/exosortase A-associated glycosyltransferase